jgi:imidazolonepropionase-like amidohydrolase
MLRPSLIAALILAAHVHRHDAGAQGAPERATALVGAHVVDVEHGVILPDQVVLVRGDRIARVAPVGSLAIPRDARIVRVDGAYVMPGLWDMHVHLRADTRLGTEPPRLNRPMTIARFQALFIAAGVTGVRDMGGDLAEIQAAQRAAQTGQRVGPRVVATGQKLGGRAVVPGAPFPIRSVDDLQRSIALLVERGAGHVKIEGLPAQLVRAALDECQRRGIPCVSHAPVKWPLAEASDRGMRSVEHLFMLPENLSAHGVEQFALWRAEQERPSLLNRVLYKLHLRERPGRALDLALASYDSVTAARLFRRLAGNGTWVTPTLMLHELLNRLEPLDTLARNEHFMTQPLDSSFRREVRSAGELARTRRDQALQFRIIREMHAAGVGLLAGTDAPLQCAPGFAVHGELVLLQRAGLRPIDALRAATLEPARYLGATDTLGTVSAGRVADLVVLRRNPLDDVRHAREIEMVMTRGRLLTRRQLDSLLAPDRGPVY